MTRQTRDFFVVILVTVLAGLTGCSSAPPLPALAPNSLANVSSSVGNELLTATELSDERAQHLVGELREISSAEARSATLLNELGGEGILRAVVLASTTRNEDLVSAVREVFRVGQPAQTKDMGGVLAQQLVGALNVSDAGQKANNALALSYLLRDSRVDSGFLVALGPGLIAADQQVTSEKKFLSETKKTWADLAEGASSSMKSFFENQNLTVAADPLLAYLSLLAKDGPAGLAVFTDTALGTTEPVLQKHLSDTSISRQRYLIERRYWGHDQFTTLTAALDAATTDKRTRNTPLAAGLVSSIMEMLGNRASNLDASGKSLKQPTAEQFIPGSLSKDAADSVMHIIGEYLPAVGYYVTPKNSNTSTVLAGVTGSLTIPGQKADQAMPVLRGNDVLVVAGSIGNPDTVKTLRGYLDNYRKQTFEAIASLYSHDEPASLSVLAAAVDTDAALEGFYARITPQEEDIQETLDGLTKTLYNSGIITINDVHSYAEQKKIAAEDVQSWFPDASYPEPVTIQQHPALGDVLAALREEYAKRTSYVMTYNAVLKG